MRYLFISTILVLVLSTSCCSQNKENESKKTTNSHSFVTSSNGKFVRDSVQYVYIGTNYWYGGLLGTEGKYGNRERLKSELDDLKSKGMINIRVLVGAEGADMKPNEVPSTLVKSPGVYNDSILVGLDYLLEELRKRDMTTVLYFSNNWTWSGGLAQWLEWMGYKDKCKENDWNNYRKYMQQFHQCDTCKKLLRDYISMVISRVNSISGIPYKEDPAIFSWEVINEPRPFAKENRPFFDAWLTETVDLIQTLDTNHMVTAGDEGLMGFDLDTVWYTEIMKNLNVDYLTIHIWAKNWRWFDAQKEGEKEMPALIAKADKFMDWHIEHANSLKKPLVLEEFGLPRNNHVYSPEAPATNRDAYYEHFFKKMADNYKTSSFSGINIWSYGGMGRAKHEFWQAGDDFLGDPPQEEQGLNNVFDTDTIMSVIKKYNEMLK